MLQKTALKSVVTAAAFTAFLSIPLSAQISLISPDGRGTSPAVSDTAHPVPAVPNAPFSAKVTARFMQRFHGDSTVPSVAETSFNIARDASGRTYDDETLSVGNSQLTTGHIYDPATRLDIYLIGEQHIAQQRKKTMDGLTEHETDPKHARTPIDAEPPSIVYGEPVWRKEDLGTKMMEGVMVHGVRLVRNIPASASGTGQPVETTDEFWYSDELHIDLLVKHTDPRGVEDIFSITQVKRGDPDPQLFQVPEDFIIVDLTTAQK